MPLMPHNSFLITVSYDPSRKKKKKKKQTRPQIILTQIWIQQQN